MLCFILNKAERSSKLFFKPIWKEQPQQEIEMTMSEMTIEDGVEIDLSTPDDSHQRDGEKTDKESPFRVGQLDYEIPDVMQQNQAIICKVRIAGQEVKLEDIQISATSTHAAIEMADEMSVKLMDSANGANFNIAAISSEKQEIQKREFTEWQISVTPLKAGSFSLFLRISAHNGSKTKDVDIFEKSIRVSGDPTVSVESIAKKITKKIVFVAADSKSGLLLGRESNKVQAEIDMSPHRDEFLLTKFFEVTGAEFSRLLLKEKPAIVHFSGHGSSQGIFLVNEQEQSTLAPTAAIKKLFGVVQKLVKVECVVLNACFSETQAEEVVSSVPLVVGTQSKIGDDEATNFSVGFYQALGAGLSYEDAFELGRVQVTLGEGNEDILVLLKQHT